MVHRATRADDGREPHTRCGELRASQNRRYAMIRVMQPDRIEVAAALERLHERGGYEIVHESPGLEVGVYVLVAPEPDRQQPHEDDEVYVVLEASGVLTVEGGAVQLDEGHAAFVPAGAEHRFSAYEHLAVLVIFSRRAR